MPKPTPAPKRSPRVPAHERPDWSKQLREIRKQFKGDLCRDFVEGDSSDQRGPPDPLGFIYCKTCGRTENIHQLRALYEAYMDLKVIQ